MDPKFNPHQSNGGSTPPNRGNIGAGQGRGRDAALSLVRSEIDAFYKSRAQHTTTSGNDRRTVQPLNSQAQGSAQNTQNAQHTHTDAEQWKKYHSAWQTYYQKYYEQYYVNEMRKNIDAQKEHYRQRSFGGVAASLAGGQANQPNVTQNNPASGEATKSTKKAKKGKTAELIKQIPLVNDAQVETLNKIRQDIIQRAQGSAKKARKSRHFIPIAAAATVCLVALVLQYNQVLIANVKAYVAPSNSQAQNVIIDPNADIPVGPENKMIIPKINVDAPVVYNVGPTEKEQLDAMANGIAHVRYPGALALPGQVGNAVFSAHSSSDWSDSGDYKFIFVQLERLTKDDVIYINYNSKRYAYKVFETKTVLPSEIGALNYTGNEPIITLITCTPLGTAQKRFLVFAKQISPDPQGAEPSAAETSTTSQTTAQMAGTNPTLIERLFGAR